MPSEDKRITTAEIEQLGVKHGDARLLGYGRQVVAAYGEMQKTNPSGIITLSGGATAKLTPELPVSEADVIAGWKSGANPKHLLLAALGIAEKASATRDQVLALQARR